MLLLDRLLCLLHSRLRLRLLVARKEVALDLGDIGNAVARVQLLNRQQHLGSDHARVSRPKGILHLFAVRVPDRWSRGLMANETTSLSKLAVRLDVIGAHKDLQEWRLGKTNGCGREQKSDCCDAI